MAASPTALYRAIQRREPLGYRVEDWFGAHRLSIYWLTPAVLIAGIVQAINLAGSPRGSPGEGILVSQAWLLTHPGSSGPKAYASVQPPLAWLQLAGWARLTNAFGRYQFSVLAGREAALAATVVSVILLFFLVRRLAFHRSTAAAAALIFTISPLAVELHRTAYVENFATPWMLAAFVLALSRRYQQAAFAAAAVLLAIAVLSSGHYLLAAPILGWVMWREAGPGARLRVLGVAAVTFVLVISSYLVLGLVSGAIVLGTTAPDSLGAVVTQPGPGVPTSAAVSILAAWWQVDPVLLVLGVLASVAALVIYRLRPFAVFALVESALLLLPLSDHAVSDLVVMLPLFGVLIAGTTEIVLQKRRRPTYTNTATIAVWCAALLTALGLAVPQWAGGFSRLLMTNSDAPTQRAEAWIGAGVSHSSKIIVGDQLWTDLVASGFPRTDVAGYHEVQSSTTGWRGYSYVVTASSEPGQRIPLPGIDAALANSVVVARFGSGASRVNVGRIDPAGTAAARTALADSARAATTADAEVGSNPHLIASHGVAAALYSGTVDYRIAVLLGQLMAGGSVTVVACPPIDGDTSDIARQVVIAKIDGASTLGDSVGARELARSLSAASAPFTPLSVTQTYSGLLVTFAPTPYP